ncbi:unnamed protein product [Prorocentrum cordatum]|uniref:PAS domain-containing protein n=1 Tax=Prorocentrum cordatum TaxID=2364126 RepID=A0ABN9UTJ5_9DINO|nr:unnamed protein product [Polarella glacialis]
MLHEPLQSDCCEVFRIRTDTEDPVWRIAFFVGRAVRFWWMQTTDSHYFASPASRRHFWRYYWISIICWLAFWFGLIFAGVFKLDIAGQGFSLSLVLLMLLSLAMTALPTTSVWSDVFITTTFSSLFWMFNVYHPIDGVVTQLPVYVLVCWAVGLHSSCVLQFCISGAICVLHCAPSVDKLILVQAVVALVPVFFLEWLATAHFRKMQNLLNVSTDGQLVINRSTGVVVSVTEQVQELLGGSALGTQFKHLAHTSDRAKIDRVFSRSCGEPSETFLATLNCIGSSNGLPTHEFEARIIPYEVTGPLLHFCIQVVGEVRSCDFGTRSSEQPPIENSSAAPGRATQCNAQQTPMNTSIAALTQIERHSRQACYAAPVAHQGHQEYGQQSRCHGDEEAPSAEHQGLGLSIGRENGESSAAHREHNYDGGTSSNTDEEVRMAMHESPDELDPSAGEHGTAKRGSPGEGAGPSRGPTGAAAAAVPGPGGERAPVGRPLEAGRESQAGWPRGAAAPAPAVRAPARAPSQLLPARAARAGGGRAPRTPRAGGVGAGEAGQFEVPVGSSALGAQRSQRSQRSRAPFSVGAAPATAATEEGSSARPRPRQATWVSM